MTLRRVAFLLAAAAVVGAFFDVVLNGRDSLSARVWLGVAAAMVISVLLRDFLQGSLVEFRRLSPAWSVRRPQHSPTGPRGLDNTHSVLVNAEASARAYTTHLRPRLMALARHYLPLQQGIDLKTHPDMAAASLAEVAWLIDPTVTDRSPSISDIERFLDLTLRNDADAP